MSEYQSYAEYLRHPRYRAVRAEAMQSTRGRCARCGAPASEVHHRCYPPWGTFDVVENLEPLCHRCHCDEHGKDD
jgi:5-methylcytosine-specific restriction endonuclease McrA